MAVTERATTHGYLSANPTSIPFPSGLTAGDLLILVWGSVFTRTGGLSGWTIVLDTYPQYANGGLAWKIATSGDVSAGSVSFPLNGAGNGAYACIAIQAGTFSTTDPIRVGGQHTIGNTSTLPITPATTVTNASSRIYYFGYRNALQTLICAEGTQQWAQNNTFNAYAGAGSLYAEDITSSVTRTPTWSSGTTVSTLYGSTFITFEVCVDYAGPGYDTEIASSLQGWWKLNETSGTTASDSSGNSRHMTYGGTAVLSQATVRPGGTSAAKATAGHVASIASATWMDRAAFTATVWVKLAAPSGSNKGFFSRYNSGAAQGAWLIWENPSSTPATEELSSGVITSAGIPVVDSPIVAVTNDIHFLALTYDSSTIKLYVDGHLFRSVASSATTAAISQELTIGAYNNSGTNPSGAIHQDATFHSAALTGAQIWAIWQGRSGPGAGAPITLSPPAATATVSAPAPTLAITGGPITLSPPAGTVSVSAPVPTLTIVTPGLVLAAAVATVTVSAPVPTLTIPFGPLTTWTADLSQQAVVDFASPPAILLVNPPAATPPATIVERTILRNSIMLDPMTVDTDTGRVDPASFDATVTGEVGVYHATVDGVDVTYWRDAPTVIGQMRFSEPGGEDSARLEFPQITSIDEAGTGDLDWLHTDAPVEIFIITPDDDRIHKFSGHLVSDNTGIGTALQSSWDVQGNIRQGDSIVHRVPTILDRTDIGLLIPKYLNDVPGRRYASIPPATTGLTSKDRGSYSDTEWDYTQNLLGSAYELDGDQWTLTRNGINQYGIALKDRSTVHWTVTAGTPGIEFDLTEDVANLVNCIYGRGVGPDGYAWAGWCHPNLLPDDAPDYPMFPITDLIEVGVVDGDTTTGVGVTTWQRRVQSLGYPITVDGVYSTADVLVCRQVQTDYGLLVDGKVGPQTWAATFDTGSGGGDLNGSYRRPLAIMSAVDPFLYAANGAIVGDNPAYDPSIIRRERNVDYGTGITKAEATILAGMELARDSVTGWQGSITLKVDPREGSRHLMREGQNILLQGFRGGDVLLHITELSVDPSDDYMPVTVSVDSKARDAMSLSSIAARDRDSRADPARRPGNPARRSRQEQDMAVEYDGESGAGVIPHFPVYGGLWSVIRIPVSEVGNVKLTLAATSGPACEFAIGFFGLPLTPAHMNMLVGDPFAAGAWDTNAEVMDEQYAFLESFGNETQACGYYPGGGTLTGRMKDTGSWEYISGKPPHIWVAIYARSTCFIEGRVYPAPVV